MFISSPDHYSFNVKQAATHNAKPALLTAPNGDQEPAVVLFSTRHVQGVLPLTDALRLATDIADALEAHRTRGAGN